MRHALTRWALGIVMVAGCGPTPVYVIDRNADGVCEAADEDGFEEPMHELTADAGVPEPIAPTSDVSTAMPRPTSGAGATAWIASCFVEPYDRVVPMIKECLARIEAFDLATGLPIFHADTREAGAVCSADLPIGTRVEIRVDVDNPACSFAYWRSGFLQSTGRPCSCASTTSSSCTFTVEADAYCGVVLTMDDALE
jgi:hypothetical protein